MAYVLNTAEKNIPTEGGFDLTKKNIARNMYMDNNGASADSDGDRLTPAQREQKRKGENGPFGPYAGAIIAGEMAVELTEAARNIIIQASYTATTLQQAQGTRTRLNEDLHTAITQAEQGQDNAHIINYIENKRFQADLKAEQAEAQLLDKIDSYATNVITNQDGVANPEQAIADLKTEITGVINGSIGIEDASPAAQTFVDEAGIEDVMEIDAECKPSPEGLIVNGTKIDTANDLINAGAFPAPAPEENPANMNSAHDFSGTSVADVVGPTDRGSMAVGAEGDSVLTATMDFENAQKGLGVSINSGHEPIPEIMTPYEVSQFSVSTSVNSPSMTMGMSLAS